MQQHGMYVEKIKVKLMTEGPECAINACLRCNISPPSFLDSHFFKFRAQSIILFILFYIALFQIHM
jgi:hypothetical protein